MLPKKARLSKKDISFVMRKPTAKLFSPHITIVFHTKETTSLPISAKHVVSFGIALSKKVFEGSVDMHRKRRVLYARIRENLAALTNDETYTYMIVVLPKKSFFDLTISEQRNLLQKMLHDIEKKV